MAAVIRGFRNWERYSKISNAYPWGDWFDGQQWRLTEADLRKTSFDDLARYAHKKAAQFGIKAKCKRIEYSMETKKYVAMVIEATCPMCKAIHSDLEARGKRKDDCFLNGFSPKFDSAAFRRSRSEYLGQRPAGFGYITVDDVHGKEGKNA